MTGLVKVPGEGVHGQVHPDHSQSESMPTVDRRRNVFGRHDRLGELKVLTSTRCRGG